MSSTGCRRGQILLAALLAGICCAAFAGYLESSLPASPAAAAGVIATAGGVHAPHAPEDPGGAGEPWTAVTAPGSDAGVTSAVAGRIARQLVVAGSLVQRGDLLFEIDPRPFQARLARAQAELAHAAATDNRDALRTAVEQARMNLEATAVRSPLTGIAGAVQARVGDLVNPTIVLATVASIDPIRVRFRLGEQDYLRYLDGLRPGASEARRFGKLEMELTGGGTLQQQGRLVETGRRVDLASRTIDAEGLFPNPGNRLRPGQIARVREQRSAPAS